MSDLKTPQTPTEWTALLAEREKDAIQAWNRLADHADQEGHSPLLAHLLDEHRQQMNDIRVLNRAIQALFAMHEDQL